MNFGTLVLFVVGVLSVASKNERGRDETRQTRNQLEGRMNASSYGANNPIEDRHDCQQLQNIDGFVCAVFDGHGGKSLSDYANSHFIAEFDKQFSELKNQGHESEDALVTEAFNLTFDTIESSFYQIALSENFSKPYNTGSCGLVSLVRNNKVYTANVGDSQGIILGEMDSANQRSFRRINNKLNANLKSEQERLRVEFPNDSDIIVCSPRYQGACYVKGRLMPTRAFGDFYLKYEDLYKGSGTFNGPYITHRPEIIIQELKATDSFIVMGSDGLWDELDEAKVSEIVAEHRLDKPHISNRLMDASLVSVATRIQSTLKALTEIPAGKRRQFHDDITIVVIDLSGQHKSEDTRTDL